MHSMVKDQTQTETLLEQMYSHGNDTKLESSLYQSSDGLTKTELLSDQQLTGSLETADSLEKLNHYRWLTWMDLDLDWKHGSTITQTTQTWRLSETTLSNSQELQVLDFGDQNETIQLSASTYKETWGDSRLQYMSQRHNLFSNLYDKWHITKMYN